MKAIGRLTRILEAKRLHFQFHLLELSTHVGSRQWWVDGMGELRLVDRLAGERAGAVQGEDGRPGQVVGGRVECRVGANGATKA
ncbi:hypothetical protein E2C01_074148 [Portunus trituberculatus]|uniref:Uncharacterized protein n=1 Tax=Portunus trituberculatus TaxID=210409 RepID=A0A5B7I799_PORTR|nr:hypothetical protein [Portunus trituberculatus]